MKLFATVFAWQVELTSLLDAVQETETKMVEMSALNHLMSTHVLQQAQQIEQLYDQVRYINPVGSYFFKCRGFDMCSIFNFYVSAFEWLM